MATYFVGKASSVSIIGRGTAPYVTSLGEEVGKALQKVTTSGLLSLNTFIGIQIIMILKVRRKIQNFTHMHNVLSDFFWGERFCFLSKRHFYAIKYFYR